MEILFKEIILIFGLIIVVYFLIKQNKRNGQVRIISGIITATLLYYFIVPALILFYQEEAISSGISYLITIANADVLDTLLAIIRVFVFLLIYISSYNYYNNRKMETIYILSNTKLTKIVKLFIWITFLIGGGAFFVYVRAFGGIAILLSYADYLRSFSTNASEFVPYLASIMVVPARLITVTPIFIVILLGFNKRVDYSLLYKIVFIASFFGAIVFSLANAGRTLIITYAMCFVIPIMQKFTNRAWKLTFISSVAALPLLDYLDALFQYFQKGEFIVKESTILGYLRQFAYPFSNVLNVWGIVEKSGIRYCRDFITGVLDVIPGINFQASYEVTSFFYGGYFWERTGGTPNDVVTFGYIELGIFGVILVAIILGVLTGKMDRLLVCLDNSFASNVLKTTMIVHFFCLVVNADIIAIVRSQFLLTIPCFCILYASSKSKNLMIER